MCYIAPLFTLGIMQQILARLKDIYTEEFCFEMIIPKRISFPFTLS